MSFGTGHHATTYLMLQALLDLDVSNQRVLDMGCGTAVLAILARMKGASYVQAIDNNEWAYTNSKENVAKNNLTQIDVVLGELEAIEKVPFQTILANINKNIIIDQIATYSEKLISGGKLLTSGFYEFDIPDIRAAAEKCGLTFVQSNTERTWCVIQFSKP